MIELHDVAKHFGPVRAVDGIDLRVAPGECLGFLGPNGAGKTTTIRMLVGLLRPTRGRVIVDGIDVAVDPRGAKQRVGYVPDRPHLYEKLTGIEFARFVGEVHGMSARLADGRAREYFALFDLEGAADALIESYSHGMRQKVVLTSALLHDPPVLVIDEPMVGLDPRSARTVRNLLRGLSREQGKTIFLSTHSLDVAEEVCGTIAIVNHGRLVALGSVEALRASARHDADLETIFMQLTEPSPPAPTGDQDV